MKKITPIEDYLKAQGRFRTATPEDIAMLKENSKRKMARLAHEAEAQAAEAGEA